MLKNSEVRCPDIWIRLPKHKWPESWSSVEDPVVPLERNLYGHLLFGLHRDVNDAHRAGANRLQNKTNPLAGLLWERQLEKVLLEHGWERFQIGNVYSFNREKGYSYFVYVDDIKIGWKETKHGPNVENTHERRWFGRTDIILWPRWFGVHSKRMSDKQRYCRQSARLVSLCGVYRARRLSCHGLLWSRCSSLPTASWPKSARVFCGYWPDPPVWHLHPGRVVEGGTRAPALTFVTGGAGVVVHVVVPDRGGFVT